MKRHRFLASNNLYGFGVKLIPMGDVFTIPKETAHLTVGIVVNDGIINNCGLLVIL